MSKKRRSRYQVATPVIRSQGNESREPVPHVIRRTCWSCQRWNAIGHLVGGEEKIRPKTCLGCGHRADVGMKKCDCDQCAKSGPA